MEWKYYNLDTRRINKGGFILMDKIDDGYYFAPYLPIEFVKTVGSIPTALNKDVDKEAETYYAYFNYGYNRK